MKKRGVIKFIAVILIFSILQVDLSVNAITTNYTLNEDENNLKQLESISKEEMENFKNNTKLDSNLVELVKNKKNTAISKNSTVVTNSMTEEDTAYVYIQLKDEEAEEVVESYVKEIVNRDISNKLICAYVYISNLEILAQLEEVVSIKKVENPIVNVATEGDVLHKSDLVRADNEGSSGSGIKIGVISDGVDHIQDSINKGALPSNVKIVSNEYGGDEGTAMLEILHAVAPDSQLYFNDCGTNKIAFNQAVDNLVEEGCNIIVDDITWITDPFFEDGIIGKHIKDVVDKTGICYVTSAGNFAENHYRGKFYNDGYNSHDFSLGESSSKSMYVSIEPGESVKIVLQWDDEFGNSKNDYDLFVRDENGSIVASSGNNQEGKGSDPLEYIFYTNDTDKVIEGQIDIVNYGGKAEDKNLEMYIYGNNKKINVVESDSIFGHAALSEVITVGAINVNNSNKVESFSSQGPISYLNGVERNKPDICGASGVSVTGSGNFHSTFHGTSASAPHIAGIAALLWSKDKELTNIELKNTITSTAKDIEMEGYDNVAGYGVADALSAFHFLKTNCKILCSEVTYKGFNVKLKTDNNIYNNEMIKYNWNFISKPEGSKAELINSDKEESYFIADEVGDYKVSLSININQSKTKEIVKEIKVKDINSNYDDIDIENLDVSSIKAPENINSELFKPIALTDGWVITSGEDSTIQIVNLFSGEIAKEYFVGKAPQCIDFDCENKLIIASLKNSKEVVKIDIENDTISYIKGNNKYTGVAFGEEGIAFTMTSDSDFYQNINIIDLNENSITESTNIDVYRSKLIEYDKENNRLYLADSGLSPSSIKAYSYNNTEKTFNFIEEVEAGGNGLDLDLSEDKKHIAFCCGGGNGEGYTVYDIKSFDISDTFGEWNIGPYPNSATFSNDSKYIIISNGMGTLKLYNIERHKELRTFDIKNSSISHDKVLFSKGRKLIYEYNKGSFKCFKSGIMDEDANANGVIDINDLATIASHYKNSEGDESWDCYLDFNRDGIIDIVDIVQIAKKL